MKLCEVSLIARLFRSSARCCDDNAAAEVLCELKDDRRYA